MSFDRCTQLCNYYHNQDATSLSSLKFSHACPLLSAPFLHVLSFKMYTCTLYQQNANFHNRLLCGDPASKSDPLISSLGKVGHRVLSSPALPPSGPCQGPGDFFFSKLVLCRTAGTTDKILPLSKCWIWPLQCARLGAGMERRKNQIDMVPAFNKLRFQQTDISPTHLQTKQKIC